MCGVGLGLVEGLGFRIQGLDLLSKCNLCPVIRPIVPAVLDTFGL